MKNGLKLTLVFALGAVAGTAASFKFIKTKYEQIAQEEIDSVKELFLRKQAELEQKQSEYEEIFAKAKSVYLKEKPNLAEYAARVSDLNYNKEGGSEPMTYDKPYVISPEEFDELEDYDTVSLTYYADKILTDENDEVVENVDELIGPDALDNFGQYEEDSVFVKNDELQIRYEILRDYNNYSYYDTEPVDGE